MHQTAVPKSISSLLNVAWVHPLLAKLTIMYMTLFALPHAETLTHEIFGKAVTTAFLQSSKART